MFKECKIVMLPVDKNGALTLSNNNLLGTHYPQVHDKFGRNKPQHLYILSNEAIKEGDWYYNTIHNKLFQSIHKDQYFENEFKVIATTDTSIKIECDACKRSKNIPNSIYTCSCQSIPYIPQSFIEKYISEYNKGNKIENVMVEYEDKGFIQLMNPEEPLPTKQHHYWIENIIPKLNQDNTINIKSVKDSWTREEVENIVHRALWTNPPYNEIESNEWINSNL